ncbi:MAG: glycosyltransferase [Bellilinea sp.]
MTNKTRLEIQQSGGSIDYFKYPAAFAIPQRFLASAWIEHTPFAMFLMDFIRPQLFVELGTYQGVSYCAFCQAAKSLGLETQGYAVDTWEGDKHGGFYGEHILADLQKYHDTRYGDFSRLVQSTFADAIKHFRGNSIDLLHIDGLHTYDAVKHDFQTWLPKLSDRAVVLFHDTNVHEKDFGVWKFWEEIKLNYPHFEFLHGHGLGILGVGKSLPTNMKLFFETNAGENGKYTRNLFWTLGSRFQPVLQTENLRAQLSAQDQHAQALQTQLSEREQHAQVLQAQLENVNQHLATLQSRIVEFEKSEIQLKAKLFEREQFIAKANAIKSSLEEDQIKLRNHIDEREQILQNLDSTLREIYGSTAWKIVQLMWKIRLWLAPNGSWRDKLAKRLLLRRSIPSVKKQEEVVVPDLNNPGEFPSNEIQSDVGIIIPVYNGFRLTKACVESIFLVTEGLNFEVLVIDNASEDETAEWLSDEVKKNPLLKHVRLPENIGFGPAVNIGLRSLNSKYLVMLNNDTLVSPGWLSNLIHVLENDSTIGIVSPVTNYVGEGQQIDERAVYLPADQNLINDYAIKIADLKDVLFEPNRLVFFCVMLRKELTDIVGYLDEGYQKGNFEDDDYCMRVRMAGYKLAIAKNALVYHHGSATFKINEISHSSFMESNRARFYEKAGRIAVSKRPWVLSTSKPVVSVIMRTKNRPLRLEKALRSLANQTFNQFEVILVNDGGEDVENVISPYRKVFQITYINHESSKGRTAAINSGISNVNGPWIAYLDDDDILYPWHFESLMQKANEGDVRFLYSNYNKSLFQGPDDNHPIWIVGAPVWEYKHNDLLITNYLPIHTYIHKTDLVHEIGFWDEELERLEDYDFLLRASEVCAFNHVNKVTCEYRFYLDSTNSVYDGKGKYLSALEKIYPKHPVTDPEIIMGRENVIQGLRDQSKMIDELMRKVGEGQTDKLQANREIIKIATGL